jgi:hypothetical protein
MLILTKHLNQTQIQITLRRPLVYLDTCIISDIAGTPVGTQIRESLVDAGTLYISWAHIVEFFGLGDGPTFQRIQEYLRGFGAHFLLIDSDANAVAKREREWMPGRQNPAIDEEFLRVAATYCHGDGSMSLGKMFDTMADQADIFKGIKRIHEDYKNNVTAMFDQQRRRYKTDRRMKAQLDGLDYGRVVKPNDLSRLILLELTRETVRTHEKFKLTDALDFSHAVVSAAYCDFTVLDKKWARRCRGRALSKLPRGAAASVYDGTEIERFLTSLQNFSQLKRSAQP